MKTVCVNTQRPYGVQIGHGLLRQTGECLAELTGSRLAALIADDTVDALYGDIVERSLTQGGFRVARTRFPHGEAQKTLATYGTLLNFLAENRLTRRDTVVALGGGVTGDLAGFAAATYLRGVNVLQLPTTLLAMVDSSVGGKTGVDLSAGKNLAGAFHQPMGVLCDVDALATLPADMLADGAAEALKYGVLRDESLFSLLAAGNWRGETEAVVERCVAMKSEVCAADERETGSRQFLNLGHTFGHAIERCSAYSIPHGHAVAVGMVMAARIAAYLGRCAPACVGTIAAALSANGLPMTTEFPPEMLAQAALADKKRAGDMITLVLPNRIGVCELFTAPVARLAELAAVGLKTD
jgi:3-dehydroquinate synthase